VAAVQNPSVKGCLGELFDLLGRGSEYGGEGNV